MAATAPTTIDAADDLAAFEAAWDNFFQATRRARARATREQPDGLSYSQLHLLRPLTEGAPRPVGELAELAGVAPPTATRMLDGLERDGLVTRAHATHDRRVVTVELTEAGVRVVEVKLAAVRARRRELFGEMSAAEREQGAALLGRLTDIIDRL